MDRLMREASMTEEVIELKAIADEAVTMWEDGAMKLDDLLEISDYLEERIRFIEMFV